MLCNFSVAGVFAQLHYPSMAGSFALLICKLSLVLEECTRRVCRIYGFCFQIRYWKTYCIRAESPSTILSIVYRWPQ